MSATWKPLSVTCPPLGPPLLVSATFTQNSYTINITDFTRVWTEAVDRKTILKRSFDEDTSIDPSEDAEQMRVFLQKIRGGIEGDNGTERILEHDSKRSTTDMPYITLQVIVDLPKPFSPLKWPIFLSPGSLSSFTEKVTIPLLAAQNARIKETESLMEILKDKDHIIQKLVEKVEAAGTDLGQIFPITGMKGGKKPSRAHAEEKLKGLAIFDRRTWKKTSLKYRGIGNLKQLAVAVFDQSDGFEIASHEDDSIPQQWDAWWQRLEASSGAVSRRAKTVAAPLSAGALQTGDEATLQVRSTPPRNSQTSNNQSSATIETIDDQGSDALDAPSRRTSTSDSSPMSTSSKAKKLGGIGGLKGKSKRSPTPEANGRANDDTVSEGEDTNSPPAAKKRLIASPNPERGGLGMLGRRKGESGPTSPLVKGDFGTERDLDEAENATKKHKLGALGRGAYLSSSASASGKKMKSTPPVANNKVEPPVRETSEERILRKREEIQKELLGKASKAPKPVRKRKF